LGYLSGKYGGWIMKQYTENGIEYVSMQPGKAMEFRDLTFSLFQ
jgi:hypothetical protein